MKKGLSALLEGLQKADGGICMSVNEFKEAQYGLPLKHYCLQYLFGSTGLRYGGFYMCAGKPKSCKSPFVFDLAHRCCEMDGLSFVYELEGKMSPTLVSSMLYDHPEWAEDGGTFKIVKGMTLDDAEKHLTKKVLATFKKMGAYDTPLLIDWDSISGAAMTDVVEKIEKEGTAGKGYYDKSHIMKYLTENWSVLVGNLPVIFVGVLQEKQKAADTFGKQPEKSYGGGDSQLFKAGTLLTFQQIGKLDNGKRIRIRTELNGFADARQIETTFVWDQFGSLETDSQGHRWTWADATALCLAAPKIVGELRDIVDVKRSDKGLVTCKQLGVTSVSPEEFEAALFAPENAKILNDLYSYHKIEKIKTPEQYIEYVKRLEGKAEASKEADKEAKAAEKAAQLEAEKTKEAQKQAKREAKAVKAAAKAKAKDPLAGLRELSEKATAEVSDSAEGTDNGDE